MIRIDQLDFVPNLPYGEYAAEELEMSKGQIKAVERASDGVWVVSDTAPLVVAGVIRQSLVGTPRLWFLLCEGFINGSLKDNLRTLRTTLDMLMQRYPKVETYVEQDWQMGEHFARFAMFRKTERLAEVYGRPFCVWER